VRRIRTIALVHESLSREPGEDIAFIEIVRPLLRLAEEGLQSPDRPVRFTVSGDGGRIPANTATPLSVVLTELLQNAVDHGFPEGSGGGEVQVGLSQRDQNLTIRVVDNGRGVDPSFDIDQTKGLGLSIVRTLVTTELNGTIDIRPATSDDLAGAGLGDGAGHQHGTVIELTVPTAEWFRRLTTSRWPTIEVASDPARRWRFPRRLTSRRWALLSFNSRGRRGRRRRGDVG
jgi:two-component system, sensor histidine kinase PdtaS